jgi:hypothetical protein
MDIFTLVASDPFYYIGVMFALVGAFGFVLMLSGAAPAAKHLLLHDGHKEHMDHYRHRASSGVAILVEAFFLWEIIRMFGDLIGGKTVTNFGIVAFMVILFGLIWLGSKLREKIFPKKEGGGH